MQAAAAGLNHAPGVCNYISPPVRPAAFFLQIADLQQRLKEADAKIVELEEALGLSEHERDRERSLREQLQGEVRAAEDNFQLRSKDIAEQLQGSKSEVRKLKVRENALLFSTSTRHA